MKPLNEQDELMVRYLCGETSPTEGCQVEQRFLSDTEYFDQLLVVEAALVDEYVGPKTPVNVRKRIEPLLVSSAFQIRQVRFARYLMEQLLAPAFGNA